MPGPASRTSPSPPQDGPSPLVSLRNVTKTYRRGRTPVHALRNVHLEIPEGEFLGVGGPSGSGKTTLLHLLAALDQPSDGSIAVGGWSLNALDETERSRYRRTMVGLVFQQFHLVPTMTARENVALPLLLAGIAPSIRRKRAGESLQNVGLEERMDHRPAALSGGEQQRVAAARALVGDPPLLLADEPTGNLDAETGARIVDLLSHLQQKQNRTVVVVTHHVDEIAAAADRIVRLRDGTISERG